MKQSTSWSLQYLSCAFLPIRTFIVSKRSFESLVQRHCYLLCLLENCVILSFKIIFDFLCQNHIADLIVVWSIIIPMSVFPLSVSSSTFWQIAEIIPKWMTLPLEFSISFFSPQQRFEFVMERLLYMSGKMYYSTTERTDLAIKYLYIQEILVKFMETVENSDFVCAERIEWEFLSWGYYQDGNLFNMPF